MFRDIAGLWAIVLFFLGVYAWADIVSFVLVAGRVIH